MSRNKTIHSRELSLLLTAAFLGVLIALQAQSFKDLGDVINRDNRADVFREIQIMKNTNDNLENEISELSDQLGKVSNNQEALNSVMKEIDKYNVITGKVDVSGSGVEIKIDGDIRAIWLTDIVNELFSAGTEAVSVNSIRLTNDTIGFDTIPNGQILLNSVILNKPYIIEAIGDKTTMHRALTQSEGIVDRMKMAEPNIIVDVEQKDFIIMKKVI